MQCPKCHTEVADNIAVCPTCKKVLQLECPNCHTLGQSAVCEKCGYTVLIKCSKCSKINPIQKDKCTKCGFSLKTSLAYQECESDDFAAIIVNFTNLKAIKKVLRTQEMYNKFLLKIKNLLTLQVKNFDGRVITYGNSYVINMNKELSLATASNKAVRLAIKIINSFVNLNLKLLNEFETPLGLKLSIVKKTSEELLDYTLYESKVKQLAVKMQKKYLKGLQVEMDQDVWEQINKEYKTDSLYAVDKAGVSVMFYELILDDYIVPPADPKEIATLDVKPSEIKKTIDDDIEKEIYSFKVFDINAKCSFVQSTAADLIDNLKTLDLKKNGKIITLKSERKYAINNNHLADFYQQKGYKVISVSCSEVMTYTPWGFLQAVFKDYYKIARHIAYINPKNIEPAVLQKYKLIFDLIFYKSTKAMSCEDARFAYMEIFGEFLSTLKDVVIIVDGIEFLDDTSIQTLELFFDKFKTIVPNFVFINTTTSSMHSKIRGLIRTPLYTEITLKRATLDAIMSTLKSDATDFVNSFYYEKLQENCRGSLMYFENVIEYLKETQVLVDFKGKLIVKAGKSIVIPKDLNGLYRARIKNLSAYQDVSLILAYSVYLGSRIDFDTLTALKVNEVEKHAKILHDSKIARVENGVVYINNYDTVLPIIKSALKNEVEVYLAKTILANIGKGLDDATVSSLMDILQTTKEKYLTLWKNADFAIKVGDYDSYLKNCLDFLSLVDKIKTKVSPEELEEDKKDVYKNILMYLYSYSPEKIYFIENILLKDAVKEGDNEKIVKLSNLMLQGALITSNYTDALGLLHNILSRMPSATWFVDGKVNMKFLLLSLVHIEVLYNVGNFRRCVEITEELLAVLNYEIVEEVKPEGFSFELFVSHIIETLRLVAFAKIYLLDDDLEEYFDKIEQLLRVDFVDKHCIFAIKDFLESKVFSTVNIDSATPFSKVVYLILQECASLKDDYNTFAQNIYQAKLLAAETHQKEIEYFCDLLIGYAYFKFGYEEKALHIYEDIHRISEKNAIFNMQLISKYFLAKLHNDKLRKEDAMLYINDALAMLQKLNNQNQLLFVLFEKIFIDIMSKDENVIVNISGEKQKLINYREKLALFFPEADFFVGDFPEEQIVESVEDIAPSEPVAEQAQETIVSEENIISEPEAGAEEQSQE